MRYANTECPEWSDRCQAGREPIVERTPPVRRSASISAAVSRAGGRYSRFSACIVARDGRTVVLVPETKDSSVTGITLLHARFAENLPHDSMRAVLEVYQGRYAALVDAVTEAEPRFDDTRLSTVTVIDLLTSPVYVLAGHWRS